MIPIDFIQSLSKQDPHYLFLPWEAVKNFHNYRYLLIVKSMFLLQTDEMCGPVTSCCHRAADMLNIVQSLYVNTDTDLNLFTKPMLLFTGQGTSSTALSKFNSQYTE